MSSEFEGKGELPRSELEVSIEELDRSQLLFTTSAIERSVFSYMHDLQFRENFNSLQSSA